MYHPYYKDHPDLYYSGKIEYWIVYPSIEGTFDERLALADRDADGIVATDYHKIGKGDIYDVFYFDFYRIPKVIFDMHMAFSTYPVKDQSDYYVSKRRTRLP